MRTLIYTTSRSGFAGKIIEAMKVWLVIKPLQRFSDHEKYLSKLESMRQLPEGTIGHDIAGLLDAEGLEIIPKFENHDLKHLVLGYGMSPEEEVRMQAYLLGNGNYSFSCLLFVCSGLLLPRFWTTFYHDFKKGRVSRSILELNIDECMLLTTADVIRSYR
jgi:ubiquinone biosynthesis protein Coq4